MEGLVFVVFVALVLVFFVVIAKMDKNLATGEAVTSKNHYRAQRTFLLVELMFHIEGGGHIFMSGDTAEIFRENGLGHLISLNEKNKQKDNKKKGENDATINEDCKEGNQHSVPTDEESAHNEGAEGCSQSG